jgi:hypothetical protein
MYFVYVFCLCYFQLGSLGGAWFARIDAQLSKQAGTNQSKQQQQMKSMADDSKIPNTVVYWAALRHPGLFSF